MAEALSLPFASGSSTSRAAADSMRPHADSVRRQIHAALLLRRFGATCDWLEESLGFTHQTTSAALRSMEKRGLVRKTTWTENTRSGRSAVAYEAIGRFP